MRVFSGLFWRAYLNRYDSNTRCLEKFDYTKSAMLYGCEDIPEVTTFLKLSSTDANIFRMMNAAHVKLP